MLFIFSTPVLIRHLWQLMAAVFLHWCLICGVLLRDTAKHLHYNTFYTVMLIVVILSVIKLSVVMLKVEAPLARL